MSNTTQEELQNIIKIYFPSNENLINFLKKEVLELMAVDSDTDSWNIQKISHIAFINTHLQVLVAKLKKSLANNKPENIQVDDAQIKAIAVELYKHDIKGDFVIYTTLMEELFKEIQSKNPNEVCQFILESGSMIVDGNGAKWQYPAIVDMAGKNSLLNNIKLVKLLVDTQDKKKNEIKEKFGELDEVTQGFERSEKEYFESEELLKSMQDEFKKLTKEIPALRMQKEKLYEELKDIQAKKGPKHEAVIAKQQDYSKVSREFNQKSERVAELDPLIKKEKVTFEKIEANYKVYNSRMESLKKKLKEFDVKYADMDKKYNDLRKNIIQNLMKKRERVV